ncbi:hypothetical protein P7L95_10355 [Bisgaard Taxon 10/6]|uniref:hypothetical protein n=1 Tax=Exercitatus varius TaxID=67857 RepID=UPI00294B60B0|nr:hypothetical protein [Exercitatus varius]MDG2957143.1 hypothetical protein [Exercitatus varius]MDG2965412.1 hypothetical protein [Exercitatus varius]
MKKDVQIVTLTFPKPKKDEDQTLLYREGEIFFTVPTIYEEKQIEVYQHLEFFEWRIIELVDNSLGIDKKIVRFDSFNQHYLSDRIALLNALAFCYSENI